MFTLYSPLRTLLVEPTTAHVTTVPCKVESSPSTVHLVFSLTHKEP